MSCLQQLIKKGIDNTYIPHITCMQEARHFMSILPTVIVDDACPTLSVRNEDIIPTVTLQV